MEDKNKKFKDLVDKYEKKYTAIGKKTKIGLIVGSIALVLAGGLTAGHFAYVANHKNSNESHDIIVDPATKDVEISEITTTEAGDKQCNVISAKEIKSISVFIGGTKLTENTDYKVEAINSVSQYKITIFKSTIDKYSGNIIITPLFDSEEPVEKRTVVFTYSDGHLAEAIVNKGEKLSSIPSPTKEYYAWYYGDEERTNVLSKDTVINDTIVCYEQPGIDIKFDTDDLRLEKDASIVLTANVTPAADYVTVNYNNFDWTVEQEPSYKLIDTRVISRGQSKMQIEITGSATYDEYNTAYIHVRSKDYSDLDDKYASIEVYIKKTAFIDTSVLPSVGSVTVTSITPEKISNESKDMSKINLTYKNTSAEDADIEVSGIFENEYNETVTISLGTYTFEPSISETKTNEIDIDLDSWENITSGVTIKIDLKEALIINVSLDNWNHPGVTIKSITPSRLVKGKSDTFKISYNSETEGEYIDLGLYNDSNDLVAWIGYNTFGYGEQELENLSIDDWSSVTGKGETLYLQDVNASKSCAVSDELWKEKGFDSSLELLSYDDKVINSKDYKLTIKNKTDKEVSISKIKITDGINSFGSLNISSFSANEERNIVIPAENIDLSSLSEWQTCLYLDKE